MRGIGEIVRGIGEIVRGIGEIMRGIGESMRGIGEIVRGIGEIVRGIGEIAGAGEVRWFEDVLTGQLFMGILFVADVLWSGVCCFNP